MEAPIRHGYFVLQARAESIGTDLALTGVVENLATGDKWKFRTADELGSLLRQWGQLAPPATPKKGTPS